MISIHDTVREPADRLTCSWGLLGSVGTYAGTAASTVGTAAAEAAAAAGQATGLSSLYDAAATALQGAGGEAGYLQSLGQQVPQGVELASPISGLMDSGPGFWGGFKEGFGGALSHYAEPTSGTQFGQGLGMLGNFIDTARGGGGGRLDAGQLLRSALSQYGIGQPAVRRYSGPAPPQPQSGLFSLSLGGNIT